MKHLFLSFFALILSSLAVTGQISSRQAVRLIKKDDLAGIKKLIANGLNVNSTYKGNSTLLHLAAEYGKFDIVKFLVDTGADMNIQNKDKQTPLLISTSDVWRNDSISEYLINKGANLNV